MQYTSKSIIGGNSSSIGQSMTVNLKAGKPATVAKFIGGASSDAYNDPQTVAAKACQKGANDGWSKLYASHTAEWQSIMTDDTVDDYRNPETGNLPADHNVVELAITAVTNPFHLLQNTIGSNALALADNDHPIDVNSISVGGLGTYSDE
jgi:trehalose/maltose hydrolase-like predicted phosphorylase